MNWKTTYILLITTSVICFLLPFLTETYFNGFGFLVIGIRAVIYLPIILFAVELNKCIETNSKSKTLRTYEIITYVIVGLLILGLLSTLFLMTQGRYRYVMRDNYYLFITVGSFASQLVLVIALFKSYKIRRLNMSNFKNSLSGDIDILDDFDSEIEIDETTGEAINPKLQYLVVEDRVKVCQVCKNKGFNSKVGIVCSLTDEKPDFVEFCTLYEEDPKAKVLAEKTTDTRKDSSFSGGSWGGAILMAILGFVRAGLKGLDDPFGIIFLVLGVVWLIIAAFSQSNKQ